MFFIGEEFDGEMISCVFLVLGGVFIAYKGWNEKLVIPKRSGRIKKKAKV